MTWLFCFIYSVIMTRYLEICLALYNVACQVARYISFYVNSLAVQVPYEQQFTFYVLFRYPRLLSRIRRQTSNFLTNLFDVIHVLKAETDEH